MTMLETPGAEVEDPAGGFPPGALDRGDAPGLVLPEEVVASLAGQLAERARSGEPVTLTGPGGLLTGVIGQVLQAGLAAELGAHLDGAGGDGGENRRNGSSAKTLNTEVGPVRLAVPRDRDGSFDPVLVPKQATPQRRAERGDHQPVRQGHERAGHRPARAADGGGGPVAGHDLAGDRRRAGGHAGVAAPAAGAVLPGDLHRRAGREGARRVGGAEQGGEHRGRDRRRRARSGCWASGSRPRRARRRGRRRWPSCGTGAWRKCCSCAATGCPAWARRSPRRGRTPRCRPARCT